MTDLLDELLGGGGKTFFTKDDPVGRSVTGTVTSATVRQVMSFETGKPETWDDGNPKYQTVITLATAERDPSDPDDDGSRNVYVKMWGGQLQALRKAAKAAGGKPTPGDTFTATYTGTTPPPSKGLNPSKVYEFRITKADPLSEALGVAEAPQTAPQPAGATTTPAPAASPAQASPDLSKVPNLRAAGLTDEQIVAATGLSLAQVQGA